MLGRILWRSGDPGKPGGLPLLFARRPNHSSLQRMTITEHP